MNDQQFLERAYANPHDDSPEFREAVAASPARRLFVDDLKKLDVELKAGLASVSAPAGLKQALLAIPQGTLHRDTETAAANDSFWRRNVHYAAGLVLAVAIVALLFQNPGNAMEDMVFTHLYSELDFLEEDATLSLEDVNTLMASWVGSEFSDSPEMENLDIAMYKDCWVDFANGVQGLHMVIKGDVGPVTIMVIPNTPLDGEFSIADDRFEGMISPTTGGNLVVVGEKEESIEQFSTLLAANINW